MFYYLEGKVAHVEPYLAVIDCGGVGYACRTTNHTIRQLKKGEVKRLYTYLNVGDGIFELYGFATEQELNSFKLLIGVSGVGPKAALAILSVGTPEHLTMAVITGDEKALTAAPGVGKKLAQRTTSSLECHGSGHRDHRLQTYHPDERHHRDPFAGIKHDRQRSCHNHHPRHQRKDNVA